MDCEDKLEAVPDDDPGRLDIVPHSTQTPAGGAQNELPDSGFGSLSGRISASLNLEYDMSHAKRGVLICLCNTRFDSSLGLKDRQGTEKDIAAITDVFKGKLGFQVDVRINLTAVQMQDIIIDAFRSGRHNLKACSCFAVVIMTHGKEDGKVCGTDREISLKQLLEPIKKCEELVGKPKMVFVQACRGKTLDRGMQMRRDGGEDGGQSILIPVEADFLYMYSSAEGHVAFQNPVHGSWFIQTLCKVLEDHHLEYDMLSMLTRVCYVLAYDYASNTPSNERTHNLKQVSSVTTTLTRLLKFPAAPH